ncbi:RNA-binding protein NOB1-like [Schistocerca gregaria]|uniref:RNA-binding protein NOB1-like n=1 Tax=Schistocerca gregaria TaxID=7010 RepID=UPI00211E3968|nr:RNA-binding protein NOB1-like [Schistocerca gregaria]
MCAVESEEAQRKEGDDGVGAVSFAVDHLVLDAGAFLKRQSVASLGRRFYTVAEVLSEVRDEESRGWLDGLPGGLRVREPSAEAYAAVVRFSRLTGDFPVLSKADLKVLALTYMLESETHDGSASHLRERPLSMEERAESSRKQGLESLPGFGEFDADGEEGWIKDTKKSECSWVAESARSDGVLVSCLTLDYAMQNVILQMGMHFTTLDGAQIHSLRQWTLHCFACSRICRDMRKLFCPSCGNNTLRRVQFYVNQDGGVNLMLDNKISVRGTRYPIPKPKSGKHAKNLILSECQLPRWVGNSSQRRTIDDAFSVQSNPSQKVVVGYGKRNPNVAKRRVGKKKR